MLMFILGVVLMGVVSFTRLPVDRLPNISVGFLNVQVGWAGACCSEISTSLTGPVGIVRRRGI